MARTDRSAKARRGPAPPAGAASGLARWGAALAVALAGSAVAGMLVFGSTILAGAQSLAAWRDGMAPRTYLQQHGGWHAREAQARLEADLHAQGLVASLVASDWGITRHVHQLPPSTQAADLSADGQQVVTSDTTRAYGWQLPGPEAATRPGAAAGAVLRQVWGAHSAKAAPDSRATGWGYGQVAWLDGSAQQLVALATRGHPALWFHARGTDSPAQAAGRPGSSAPSEPPAAAAPRPLSPAQAFDGLNGLAARQGALVLWHSGQDQVHWLPHTAAAITPLAHPGVALAAWTTDGTLLTASRAEVRRWRGSTLLAQHRWAAEGEPLAASDDGAWAVVQADEQRLTVLSTAADGPPPAELLHDAPVRPASVCGPWLASATSDGRIWVWQRAGAAAGADTPQQAVGAGWRLVRQWPAYVGPIGLLVCRGERLLSAGRSGLGEHHAMVWDLAGRPQPGVPPPPGHDRTDAAWADRTALWLGLGEPGARPLLDSLRAHDHWLQPAGVVVWLLTLVGAGGLLRRR